MVFCPLPSSKSDMKTRAQGHEVLEEIWKILNANCIKNENTNIVNCLHSCDLLASSRSSAAL